LDRPGIANDRVEARTACVARRIGMDDSRKTAEKGKKAKAVRERESLPSAPHETPPDRGGSREPTAVERKEIRKGGG
jgi:hypothetical protein